MRDFLYLQKDRIIRVVMILGAFSFSSHIILEQYYGYDFVTFDYYMWLLVSADTLLTVLFVIVLEREFQLGLANSLLDKRKIITFLFGIAGLGLLVLIYSFLSRHQLVNYYNKTNLVSAILENYPAFRYITNMVLIPVLTEVVFRGLFFKLFFQKDSRSNHFLLIFMSGFLNLIVWLISIGMAITIFDVLFMCLSGWLFAAIQFYGKDVKLPIILHIILSVYLLL